jgi:hypothetical protein
VGNDDQVGKCRLGAQPRGAQALSSAAIADQAPPDGHFLFLSYQFDFYACNEFINFTDSL